MVQTRKKMFTSYNSTFFGLLMTKSEIETMDEQKVHGIQKSETKLKIYKKFYYHGIVLDCVHTKCQL